jgi:hypothetical protein
MRVNFFMPRSALPGPLRLGKMAWPKWKPVKQHRVAHWQLNSVGYERLPDPALSDRRGTPARDERGRGPCDWGSFRSPSSLTSAPLGPPMSVRTHPGATTTNPAPSSGVGCVAAASTSIRLIAMRPRRGGRAEAEERATEARASIVIEKAVPRTACAHLLAKRGIARDLARDGHRFEFPQLHQEVRANRGGFLGSQILRRVR